MQLHSAREGPNLLPDIVKYNLEAGYSKWHQKTALTHCDRFLNQLCIDCFAPHFLREESDATNGCECMSICAWLLCLLHYCAKP